jgi:hypothetical protein
MILCQIVKEKFVWFGRPMMYGHSVSLQMPFLSISMLQKLLYHNIATVASQKKKAAEKVPEQRIEKFQ